MYITEPYITDEQKRLFENMSLEQLKEEKKAAQYLLNSLSRGSYLYELTMKELGFINRCITDIYKIMYKWTNIMKGKNEKRI